MTNLQTRIDALERTTAAAEYCTCPLTIQIVDYRVGIDDLDGGAGAESEICEHCGKVRAIIRIVITGDTVDAL